ncbi:MAG: AEC family transporter [Verrucomicrobiota bacterium]|nr:AEC family transporter [Verrucomicrobiota bacterium]
MISFWMIVAAIAPVFLVIAAGWAARHAGWLTPEADGSLLRLVMNLLYPALILHYTLGNDALNQADNLVLPPLVGFFTVVLGFGLVWVLSPYFRIKQPVERRTFAFTTGLYNYGYIPIPLVELLFRDRDTAGVLLVHNVGVEVAFWTVGILLVSGSWNRESLKKLINPTVIALIIGVTLNLTHLGKEVPMALRNGIAMISACAIPIGLMLTGATLCELTKDSSFKRDLRLPLTAILLRIGILPVLFLLLAKFLPCSEELRRVIVIQAAMPAAMLPVVVARHYGGDASCAVKVVMATTLVSLITIPLWLSLGLRLIFPGS